MSAHHKKNDPFTTIDLGTLDKVNGGAGDGGMGDMMLPMMMMMMRGRGGSAPPPPPPPAPVKPKVLVNGVEQQMTGNNMSVTSGGDE